MKLSSTLLSLLLLAIPGMGQPAAEVAQFEVVSIRECAKGDRTAPSSSSPGRLSLTCWPLRRLIQDAYDVFGDGVVNPLNPAFPFTPMQGGPDWINSVQYTINARVSRPETAGGCEDR